MNGFEVILLKRDSTYGREVTNSFERVINVINTSKKEAKKAAMIPVTNPKPTAVTASIFNTELSVRLYKNKDNIEASGIIRQQPKP